MGLGRKKALANSAAGTSAIEDVQMLLIEMGRAATSHVLSKFRPEESLSRLTACLDFLAGSS